MKNCWKVNQLIDKTLDIENSHVILLAPKEI